MGHLKRFVIIVISVLFISANQLYSQNESPSKVKYLNAPVLFKKDGKSFQQIIANYRSEDKGKILLLIDNKEVLNSDLVKGRN